MPVPAWPPGSPAGGWPLGGPATRPPCSKPGKEEAPLEGTGVAIPPPPRGRKRRAGASQKLAGRVPMGALHPALCSWACKGWAGPEVLRAPFSQKREWECTPAQEPPRPLSTGPWGVCVGGGWGDPGLQARV